jgi:acyl-CoA reductase-like NAD-dependent aldehyde dehydrogenase
VAALRVGDPLSPETEVGPLIHPREADRVSAWTDEAVSAGARLIGGGRLSSTTLVPAIIVSPPCDAKVSTLEVFGPVTCVYPFTRLDDAIAAANSLPMAFQASIFTEDLRTAFDAGRAPRRLGRNGQRPYRLPHRLDALRRAPPVRLRHRRYSLVNAGND